MTTSNGFASHARSAPEKSTVDCAPLGVTGSVRAGTGLVVVPVTFREACESVLRRSGDRLPMSVADVSFGDLSLEA